MPTTINTSGVNAPEAGTMMFSGASGAATALSVTGTISVSSGSSTISISPNLIKSAGLAIMPRRDQDQVDFSAIVVCCVT